jgi:hypothetical protein
VNLTIETLKKVENYEKMINEQIYLTELNIQESIFTGVPASFSAKKYS